MTTKGVFQLLLLLCFTLLTHPGYSSAISGAYNWHAHLYDENGKPIPYANVSLSQLNTGAVSDKTGHVEIANLPAGEYTINISVIGYVSRAMIITLPQSTVENSTIILQSTLLEGSAVTVTVTGLPSDILTSERTVSVIGGETLQRNAGQSLSATLATIPGLQVISQGHAVAKPVVRGMSSQRVVIVKDGIKQEGQQWGGHHSPEVDVLSLGKIEVVRGPMSLLYGSEAMGGVIQLEAPKLRTLNDGGRSFAMAGRLGFQANSQQIVGGLGFQKSWDHGAIRANISGRNSDNYAAPGNTQFLERVDGTAYHQINGGFHLLQKYQSHELEILGTRYEEEQTLIGAGHWHNSGGGVDGTEPWYHVLGTIVSPTQHNSLTLKGKWLLDNSWIEYDFGSQLNHRTGGIGGENPVVDLTAKTYAGNVRWLHLIQKKFPGTFGISYLKKKSTSIGSERLLPDYNQSSVGMYSFYRWMFEPFTFSGGLRIDATSYDILATNFAGLIQNEDVTDLYFPISSGSVGLVWHQTEMPYSIALNLGTGWRPPNPYELYISGIHHGDWKIEIGNPELRPEASLNSDLIFRHVAETHTGELTFYYNKLKDYIISAPTGLRDEDTGIPIYHISQGDAHIYGSEMRLNRMFGSLFEGEVGWDYIRGESLLPVVDADEDGVEEAALPGISPARVLFGVSFFKDKLAWFQDVNLKLQNEFVFAQNHLAEFENVIDDGYGNTRNVIPENYQLLSLALHGKLRVGSQQVDISLGVDNLLNEQYYSHLSKYKGLAFDQGLNVHGEIRYNF
ncbi:MAG: TonB-dependent receptor [Candidatus Marinimicrobia bacterium]|nr:TonB-dependent receptor [Candidatus Neomarinimicrobiota bacterium]